VKRIAIVLCAALAAGVLTGCDPSFLPRSQDISHVELVRTLAIDDSREKDRIKVTVASGVKRGPDGSPGKPLVLTEEAETVFSACQMIQKSGSGHVTYGHVTECVVGEQAARAGINRVLDYIQRDFEMRMDTLLFLVEQEEASVLVNKTASKDSSATDRLQEIGQMLPLKSEAWPCTVREFLIDLYDNGWAMMPVVKLEKKADHYDINTDGMALFQEARLVEKLDDRTGRGACLLLNQGKSGHVDITLKDGSVAGLKLVGINCRWSAQWEGDTLTGLSAELDVKADLAEVSGKASSQDAPEMQKIEERLAAQITEEAAAALEKEKAYGDFLHLKRKLTGQYPGRVELIQARWEQWLETLTFHVTARAVVKQSYDVNRETKQS
jgi:spore germination protein KC